MSSGLMSCVRENSPPLEMDANESGALSLPETSTTEAIEPVAGAAAASSSSSVSQAPASPGAMSANCESAAASNVDILQLKRRRFNPLRNLRRIFRRRTITSINDNLTSPVGTVNPNVNLNVIEKPTSSTRSGGINKNNFKEISAFLSTSPSSSNSTSVSAAPINSSQQQHLLLDGVVSPDAKSLALKNQTTGIVPLHTHRNALLVSRSISPQSFQYKQQSSQPPELHHHQLQLKLFGQQKLLSTDNDLDVMYLNTGQSETAANTANFHNLRHQQHHQYHQQQQQQSQQYAQHMNTYNVCPAFSSALAPISGQRSLTIGAIPVLPIAFNAETGPASLSHRGLFADRLKLNKSVCDSSQELDSSTNSSFGNGSRHVIGGNERHIGSISAHSSGCGSASGSGGAGEITDNQRSFSEGRLVDSDYSHDGLSQSHDSVFSESATASSLSIVLKAELADALRKRRNRPDVSDEDLGLPRSPASSQRRNTAGHTSTPTTAGNHSDVSSLSMLSMNSNDGDIVYSDLLTCSSITQDRSQIGNLSNGRHSKISAISALSPSTSDVSHSNDGSNISKTDGCFGGIDIISTDWQKLSHSAARHKMAVRPPKKKGPSRKHRKILETSIPEANEELFKMGGDHLIDLLTDQDDLDGTTEIENSNVLGVSKADRDTFAEIETSSLSISNSTEPSSNSNNNINNNINNSNITNNKSKIETISKFAERHRSEKVDPKTFASTSINNNNNNKIKEFHHHPPTDASSMDMNSLSSRSQSYHEALKIQFPNDFAKIYPPKPSPAIELNTESLKIPITDDANGNPVGCQTQETIQTVTESGESCSLQRLIQRNSKRTFSKDTNDSTDMQSEAKKKQQIPSPSCDNRETLKSSNLEKFINVKANDPKIEKVRKDIKCERLYEANPGLSAMISCGDTELLTKTNTNISVRDANTILSAKPKSGAAARQRYLPKEIITGDTLERSLRNVHSKSLPMEAFSQSALTKPYNEEIFQSTSIIRKITAASQSDADTPLKPDHLFEKKPKIIGLSSFQQKISRTNDTNNYYRSNSNQSVSSSSSIDISGEAAGTSFNYDQRQRKAVEKSRSFRIYNENKDTDTSSVRNNMPSLPDLSLQLPRFGEFILNDKEYSSPSPPDQSGQCSSLGFEINDNNLMRSSTRTESSNSLSPFTMNTTHKNTVTQAKSGTSTKLLTPPATVLPNLSPTNSIAEIEQTIDMIVKSPFVSVLRKPKNSTGETTEAKLASDVRSIDNIKKSTEFRTLNGNQRSAESKNSDELLNSTWETPVAPISREKMFSNRCGSNITELTNKESERRSYTAATSVKPPSGYCKSNTFGRTRRTSSINESSTDEDTNPSVPEFLKIQLNRVDPGTRAAKSTVVLSKNARDSNESTTERSVSIDDLSLRRFSNTSVEIHENAATDSDKSNTTACLFEAINKQTKSLSTSSLRHQPNELPPKSPVRKSPNKHAERATPSDTASTEDIVILRQKAPTVVKDSSESAKAIATNKITLQERKRLFMNEDKIKTDKKLEELKSERKKSINEELQRKSINDCRAKDVEEEKEPIVVLRKKCNSINHGKNIMSTNNNNNVSNNNANGSINLNGHYPQTVINKEDSTPELMKVFARRSLKIKDEDLMNLPDKLLPTSSPIPLKKSQNSQSNVDNSSDKENQSASEEKLDKITPKLDETVAIEKINSKIIITNIPQSVNNETVLNMPARTTTTTTTTASATPTNFNRNSLTKFGKIPNSLTLSKAANNSNNNNNLGYQITIGNAAIKTLPNKSYLNSCHHNHHHHHQAGRFNGGFRTISVIEQRNHNGSDKRVHLGLGNGNGMNNSSSTEGLNINNNNNATNKHQSFNLNSLKSNLDQRQSLCLRPVNGESNNCGNGNSKTIERSATVSEFKGIHQRRAEWEQRAKEALK